MQNRLPVLTNVAWKNNQQLLHTIFSQGSHLTAHTRSHKKMCHNSLNPVTKESTESAVCLQAALTGWHPWMCNESTNMSKKDVTQDVCLVPTTPTAFHDQMDAIIVSSTGIVKLAEHIKLSSTGTDDITSKILKNIKPVSKWLPWTNSLSALFPSTVFHTTGRWGE